MNFSCQFGVVVTYSSESMIEAPIPTSHKSNKRQCFEYAIRRPQLQNTHNTSIEQFKQ